MQIRYNAAVFSAVLFGVLVRKVLFGVALSKLVLLALLLLSLALSYIPDRAFHTVDNADPAANFHVIEFNDLGLPHDNQQLQRLDARIQALQGQAELLIFIHGWHHSAKPDDENFLAFQQFYQQMAAKSPERKLIGLYIGWRGDKYDPFWLDGSTDAQSQVEALDFLTIFERKSVARHIGKTGFADLLDHLDSLELQGLLKRYTVIGHSLGGAMALHASKSRISASISQGLDNPNLFILLNPAVRASEYKPMDQLLSLDRQKPAMVVLQSKTDFALKEAWQYLQDGERVMGNSWAITHDIDRCPRGNCSIALNIPKALAEHDAKPGCLMTLPQSGWKIRARLQARRTVQTCPDANMQAVWVLAVSDDIISGHNGILTAEHAGALGEVMSMIDRYQNKLPQGSAAVSEAARAAGALSQAEAAAEAVLNEDNEVDTQDASSAAESQDDHLPEAPAADKEPSAAVNQEPSAAVAQEPSAAALNDTSAADLNKRSLASNADPAAASEPVVAIAPNTDTGNEEPPSGN